jgi:glycerate dehydrogenase
MGIIGYGAIGQAVAEAAQAFGMKILVATRTPKPQVHPKVCFVTLDELFAQADVVSLHCPLTPQTANIICAENLAKMKPTAFLLNTSRGGLVHEQDLADALNNDRIAGAGVDVLSIEPPSPDNPLLHAKNIVITPHCAWATRRARQRLLDITIANIQAFQSGHAINVVNGVN